jgi:hypothetical protein
MEACSRDALDINNFENRIFPLQYGPLQELNLDVSIEVFLSAERPLHTLTLCHVGETKKMIAWLCHPTHLLYAEGWWRTLLIIVVLASTLSLPTANKFTPWLGP